MMLILNNLVLIIFFTILIASYKNELNIKKYIIFDFLLLGISTIIIYFLKIQLNIYIILLQIVLSYISLKIILKKHANILDIFIIMFYIVMYKLLNKIIMNELLIWGVLAIISLMCLCCRKIIYINYLKLITLWKRNDEKSITLRCVFVILFNFSIYVIYRFL